MNYTNSNVRDHFANRSSPRSTSGMLDSPIAVPSVPTAVARSQRRCVKTTDYIPLDDNVFVDHAYEDANVVLLNAIAPPLPGAAAVTVECVQNGTKPHRLQVAKLHDVPEVSHSHQRGVHTRHGEAARLVGTQNLLQIADYHPDNTMRTSPLTPCEIANDCKLLEVNSMTKNPLAASVLDTGDATLRSVLEQPETGVHSAWTPRCATLREAQAPFYHKLSDHNAEEVERETCLTKSDYRYLGRSGLRVSVLSLGTWVTFGAQISDEMAEQILTFAYENGINFFDTAEVYGGGRAEMVLGNILKSKGWRRSSYIVSTKIFWGGKAETERGLSRKHIIEGVKNSLQRLQMDYVDIVFANKFDPHTPVEEIVRAFTFVINQGWAMYWGTSRWSTGDIMTAYSTARQFNLIPPSVEQAEYHLFQREKVEVQLPELMQKIGIGTITWSPLACGILTGKYDDGIPIYSRAALQGYGWLKEKILSDEGRRQQEKLRKLNVIANRLDCTLAQLAIAWCVKNSSITSVLLGVSSVEQLYENLLAVKVAQKLNANISRRIEEILKNNPGCDGHDLHKSDMHAHRSDAD